VLVSRPLTNLQKANQILKDHFVGKDGKGKLSHAEAIVGSKTFKNYMEDRCVPVDRLCDSIASKQIEENKLKLKINP